MLGSLASPRKSSYRQHHKLSNVQDNPLTHPVGNIAEFKERTVCITANTVILEHTRGSKWLVSARKEYQRISTTYRLSMRASSPSTWRDACGVTASRTKWLSQCGQYSSLKKDEDYVSLIYVDERAGYANLSSNSEASFRKHFLHFLHAKI